MLPKKGKRQSTAQSLESTAVTRSNGLPDLPPDLDRPSLLVIAMAGSCVSDEVQNNCWGKIFSMFQSYTVLIILMLILFEQPSPK
jgi:hypothetical protein